MIKLHSDDFGYKSYSDKKIIQLLKRERITSVSVLVNMCEKRSLNSLIKIAKSKNIKIGLHLNLIEGKSLEKRDYIPSIVSGRGKLFTLKKFILRLALRMINPDHIEREVRSQIKALRNSGLKVSFIDSHQHLHAISPVAEIVAKVANEENIRSIRSYKSVKTYTIIAKLKYLFLKLGAYLSYVLNFGKIGLPASWNRENSEIYSFMSWESHNFDVSGVKDKRMVFVTHPYLPFDTNQSYTWMLF